MPLRAIARLIQTMLYARRFFPYYVYNILGGIEEDGKLLPQTLVSITMMACVYPYASVILPISGVRIFRVASYQLLLYIREIMFSSLSRNGRCIFL